MINFSKTTKPLWIGIEIYYRKTIKKQWWIGKYGNIHDIPFQILSVHYFFKEVATTQCWKYCRSIEHHRFCESPFPQTSYPPSPWVILYTSTITRNRTIFDKIIVKINFCFDCNPPKKNERNISNIIAKSIAISLQFIKMQTLFRESNISHLQFATCSVVS